MGRGRRMLRCRRVKGDGDIIMHERTSLRGHRFKGEQTKNAADQEIINHGELTQAIIMYQRGRETMPDDIRDRFATFFIWRLSSIRHILGSTTMIKLICLLRALILKTVKHHEHILKITSIRNYRLCSS